MENLDGVLEKERICKVSVYDRSGAKDYAMRVLPTLLNGLKLTLSGEHWCDVSSPTADKGTALNEVQRLFGLKKEECMAFGDHMNDLGMLRACGHPIAVANAVPAVKEIAERIVPANTDGGVLIALNEILAERKGL